jgi:cytochrome P450
VVTLRTLFHPCLVMVFDPELTRQVFRGSPEHLRAGEANAVLGPIVGPRSLLLLDGAEHLRHRRLLLKPFHGERMRAYEATMREATDRAIDGWPVGEPFALLGSMQALTLDVILLAVFGVQDTGRRADLHRAIRAMLAPMGTRRDIALMMLSGGRAGATAARGAFVARRNAVDGLIHAEISARRVETDLAQRTDVLSMLLLARDEDGAALNDDELRDELVTLLVAGHETTATALAWAFERLLANPATLGRLRGALAAGDRSYLDAVVKETLRARPIIAGIGRRVRGEAQQVGSFRIEPGVEINPSLAGIHRCPDHYPQPREFRPERFLGDEAPDGSAWVPFGGGTRRCPGASFATFEMAAVIARVLERTALQPAWKRRERPIRKGVTFVPRDGVRVRLTGPPTRG